MKENKPSYCCQSAFNWRKLLLKIAKKTVDLFDVYYVAAKGGDIGTLLSHLDDLRLGTRRGKWHALREEAKNRKSCKNWIAMGRVEWGKGIWEA